jgi:hypothetical protein
MDAWVGHLDMDTLNTVMKIYMDQEYGGLDMGTDIWT